MKLQPIQDVEGFKKDEESGAVLAIDNRGLEAYKRKKQQQTAVLVDINNIKEELSELKGMIKLILSSQQGK